MLKKTMLLLAAGIVLFSCSTTKKTSGSNASIKTNPARTDTTKKNLADQPKSYSEIITAKAITSNGFFKVHKVENNYYFEIPDSLLDKDILVVNRIRKSAAFGRFGPVDMYGYAGDIIGENVISFSRGPNNQLLLRKRLFWEMSKDSSKNGIYTSLENSSLPLIVGIFDIKAFSGDSTGSVIDMTNYLNEDNEVISFNKWFKKKKLGLGGMEKDKSYINNIVSFPLNVEVRTIKTYFMDLLETSYTFELNSSFVLLPAVPMKPRFQDDRVGYFSQGYSDYDNNGMRAKFMITRWRLEPRDEDMEKYRRGELAEPKKPIVYYIDPATPAKWVPYLMQGVNDWQKAFEQAGFKNAIYAKQAPTPEEDSTWSIDDARHNAIVYKASRWPNASGPNVHDPRTGEILETHINWYHNVMSLIKDWYMIQAGAIDPKARKMVFDDSLMGQLIRFVCAHEVGHTLGLQHNFGSSSTIPVDSLRSKKYVEQHGICPSIMDYARMNYVAQPEDNIGARGIINRIGIYDEWAIEWGYRVLPDFKTEEEEKTYLNKWIIDRISKDKRLWFAGEGGIGESDWRSQTEDLGDNSMKAGYYGIQNLKRILPKLVEWTKEPNGDPANLLKMQQGVYAQFNKYLLHVATHIGSWIGTPKTVQQEEPKYEFTSREQQKAAIQFLQEQLFTTPEWVMNKKIFSLAGGNGYEELSKIQNNVLRKLLNPSTFSVLLYFETNHPTTAYTISELLNDLESGIWSELKRHQPIDLYRRNLQKTYIKRLLELNKDVAGNSTETLFQPLNSSDITSVTKGHIRQLITEINKGMPFYKDKLSRMHLQDVKDILQSALDIKTVESNSAVTNKKAFSLFDKEQHTSIGDFKCTMFEDENFNY